MWHTVKVVFFVVVVSFFFSFSLFTCLLSDLLIYSFSHIYY